MDLVELRQNIPAATAQLLDAVALARQCSRAEVVAEVLNEFAARRLHEATVIARVTRGNGASKEPHP